MNPMVLFLALACAHTQATWEYVPHAAVDQPLPAVSVIVSDPRCRDVADALAVGLSTREGIQVVPDASARLHLNLCRVDIRTEVDVTQLYPGLGAGLTGGVEQRDVAIRGAGQAVMTVEIEGKPVAMVNAEGHRVRMIRETDTDRLQRRATVQASVIRDLADELAQKVAPTAERIRRRWYRNPTPGTARALHNQAVDAERTGDLGEALRLARMAVEVSQTVGSVGYVRALEQRVSETP